MTDEMTVERRKKALLAATYTGLPNKRICEEHLDELELLADTFGIDTALKVPCPLRRVDASTFFGKGKLEELGQMARDENVDLIIVDEEISPSQQRNLEEALKMTVMDRTEVILGVFGQRAHSREARLQIELAQVKYQIPRLKRLWTHLSRQAGTSGGGGAYLKGEGEKQIELDRRMLKSRAELLEREIEVVRTQRHTQRVSRQRNAVPTFAIIGYTNAGKSTLLNALTQAGVFVENKLFATLDTTTRRFTLPNNHEILLIDTVGFIRKLPHLLVAAFKSTLEEALFADFLLHVIDASHPLADEQAETTFEVLKELNAGKKPIITVLNKCDKPEAKQNLVKLRMSYPKNVMISALQNEGFDLLAEAMEKEIRNQRSLLKLHIPQSDYAAIAEIMRTGTILKQEYVEDEVHIEAEVPFLVGEKLQKYKCQE